MNGAKILIVEDDDGTVAELRETLSLHGFSTQSVQTVRQFNAVGRLELFDLIVVDLGLPDGFGNNIIRDVRKRTEAGIIVLSGHKSEIDKVLALELGADDYVEKPYRSSEFVARVQSVLRRISRWHQGTSEAPRPPRYTFNGYTLDTLMRRLTDKEGKEVRLTKTEFEVLSVFARKPNQVLTRENIIYELRGGEWAGYDRAIDGIVCRLRAKVSATSSTDELIKTLRGVGYLFSPISDE